MTSIVDHTYDLIKWFTSENPYILNSILQPEFALILMDKAKAGKG
jgi:hypothetical protein